MDLSRAEAAKGMGRLRTNIAPGHYTGLQKAWENIRDRAGLPGFGSTICGTASRLSP